MIGLKDAIPIDALFDDNLNHNPSFDCRQALADAQVIIGIDVMSGHPFIVYGRDAVKRIAADKAAAAVPMLVISLDQATGELEKLVALVRVVKGRHDYQPRAPGDPLV